MKKADYEAEIQALQNRILRCEAACKRLQSAKEVWDADGGVITATDEFDAFCHALDDLFALARVNVLPSFTEDV